MKKLKLGNIEIQVFCLTVMICNSSIHNTPRGLPGGPASFCTDHYISQELSSNGTPLSGLTYIKDLIFIYFRISGLADLRACISAIFQHLKHLKKWLECAQSYSAMQV